MMRHAHAYPLSSSPGLTGRPGIPETSTIESRSRGVLDTPHARGMTAGFQSNKFDVSRRGSPTRPWPSHSTQDSIAIRPPTEPQGVASNENQAAQDRCRTTESSEICRFDIDWIAHCRRTPDKPAVVDLASERQFSYHN
jgi:hypothetical protein